MSETERVPEASPQVPEASLAELHALMAEIRNLEGNVTLARMSWGRRHGLTHGGARDTYQVFGYPDTISVEEYRDAYSRGGLAGTVVDVMPDATWRGETPFELIEDENPDNYTEFENAWIKLEREHQIFAKLQRTDKLSRLSTYAVLLIGAEGDWSQELPQAGKKQGAGLLYLMPFLGGGGPGTNNIQTVSAGADATVFEYDTDSTSKRFGLPKSYMLKRTDVAAPDWGRPVHWSRVIHVAEGLLDDEVFGQPALERVWNLLLNLDKVTGGGSESFWLRANQGLHLDIDKDLQADNVQATIDAVKAQAEEYKHQLTRWLRTRGVKVQTLGSDVANFEPSSDGIITQIAGAKRIPKRILTGAEMGELASTQDRENFRDQIIGRQTQYAAPYIIRPLVDRLIKYGYLPTPKAEAGYQVKWPHIQVLTDQEKADGAQKWSQTTINNDPVFTDSEVRDHWYGMIPLTDEQRQEITDRAMEKAKQAQEVMQMTQKAPPEDKPDTEDEKLRTAAEGYKLSSTQVQLPPVLAGLVMDLGKSIPAFDLCDEEGGLEDDIHITVKYGLHTNDVADVRRALATYVGPIRFTLGKTNVFVGPEYDVLYVEVTSPDLVALHERLSNMLENTSTHPVYVPHVTVGYLKTGLGVRYVGMNAVEGMSATVGSVRFSPADGGPDVDLRITGRAPEGKFAVAEGNGSGIREDMELVGLLAAAIETGEEGIVRRIVGLGDVEGHPFHGNQYTEGGTVGGNSSGRSDKEIEEASKDKPNGTVLLKSKYGQVEVQKSNINPDAPVRYNARYKSGELAANKSTLREAKEALRKPREADRDNFHSGYMKPDVKWKEVNA